MQCPDFRGCNFKKKKSLKFYTPVNNITGVFFMSKRVVTILVTLIFALSVSLGRIAFIMFSGEYKVSSGYNSYSIDLSVLKPTIYDCKLNKLNNNKTEYAAIIRPNKKCLNELQYLFTKAEVSEIKEELSKGYPVIRKVNKPDDSLKYIQFEKILVNDKSNDVFINSIMNNFNDEIGSKKVNFSVDALGRLLEGDNGTIVNNNYSAQNGVILTLNSKIQQIAVEASKSIKKGAVVVMDVENSNILALVSRGNDYLNRANLSYSVGSIFKLAVCISAIENNIDADYNCEGSITVGDTTYSCQKEKAHGSQNMKQALANSCNCYFVNLALLLGADKITQTAQSLGFGEDIYLEEKITVKGGSFPSETALKSKGQLALLGFGQGELTDSPVHFCAFAASIANGGIYNKPNIILGSVDANGGAYYNEDSQGERVMKASTAYKLTDYMRYVVSSGTGRAADYNSASAGKTSTSQSGQYIDNQEQYNTWFAGFYPYKNPKYAIVVMTEHGTSGAGDCCPVFRTIVENLS